jgi:hypothetical protein
VIKEALVATDWIEAVLCCQKEKLGLERKWRDSLYGRTPDALSQMRAAALAGKFCREPHSR